MPAFTPICRGCGGPRVKGDRCKVCSYNYAQNYYNENAEWLRKDNIQRHNEKRIEVINAYGGKCACCGESHVEFLSVDHVNGGGNKHRRELFGQRNAGGHTFYVWLIRNGFPADFRLLCNNCNMSLGMRGYCPHHPEARVPVVRTEQVATGPRPRKPRRSDGTIIALREDGSLPPGEVPHRRSGYGRRNVIPDRNESPLERPSDVDQCGRRYVKRGRIVALWVEAFGECLTTSQWSARTGVHKETIRSRLTDVVFEWTPERAVTTPATPIHMRRGTGH